MYRKDFTRLTNAERTTLAAGFNHLFSTGLIESNAILHNTNFNGGIIHWGPAFLPWHRDFLRKLEIQLQAFNPSINLPYWDWTRGDSRDIDVGIWESFFGGRNNIGGQFDSWLYTRRSHDGGNTLPSLADIIQELRANTYFEYRRMETGSHPPGHTWTGGSMAMGTSPRDPLFYLHHCNLDRLWAIWQQNNPGIAQYTTTLGNSGDINPNPNLVGLNDSMAVGTTETPNNMLDHTTLGYLYERDPLLEIAWFESEGTSIRTGDPRPADLFIRDSNTDTGVYPSPVPHWTSPDIWVRNADPSTPGEDPSEGHQIPILNQINYLYARVENRGSANATGISVEAYHCNPGTGMLWPDDFASMGTQSLPGNIAVSGSEIYGPFPWTPTVADHECLLAIVDAGNDPNTLPMFYNSVPHWHLVRFDNSVGQRNVHPVMMSAGGRMTTSLRIRGGLVRTTNRIRLDASVLPVDTSIRVTLANSIASQANFTALNQISSNSRFTTFEMSGQNIGQIDGFDLRAREDRNLKLLVDFSFQANHEEHYPMIVSQYQEGIVAGEMTIDFIAIKESNDYFYGNPKSKEMHTIHCPFWNIISPKNKIPFNNAEEGIRRGYNGCAFCLSEHDTG